MPRPALVRTLMASDAAVIAIAAPAGYGKSALLAEWSAADPRPFAWVSVDAADNDPGALLRYIAAAYADGGADRCQRVGRLRGGDDAALAGGLSHPGRRRLTHA